RFAEPVELWPARQAGQRALLELTRPLGREAELATGLAQRPGLVAGESEAKADHVALHLRELLDDGAEALIAVRHRDFLDRLGTIAGKQFTEFGLAVLTHRLVH